MKKKGKLDKRMILNYWNFDIDKELREFKASSVAARRGSDRAGILQG